jgi:hypothetical protein
MTAERGAPGHGWCSLRLRFDERELVLLRDAEQARGAALAHQPRPDMLRTALALSKAGQKLRSATPGTSLTFEEPELQLLRESVRFANEEVHWAATQRADGADPRRDAVLAAFPELVERGLWRSFGLTRELDELGQRLEGALRSM